MIVEERDCVIVAEVLRLRIKRGNCLAKRKLPRRTRADDRLAVVAKPHRLAPAGRR